MTLTGKTAVVTLLRDGERIINISAPENRNRLTFTRF
jgi:hypothetical protein